VGNEKNVCFFDGEGVVSKKPFNLVKNGVLTGLLTYKRSASNYSLPLMGSAEGEYDEVPSVTFNGWRAENTAETLGKLVKDRAIYVCMTSGGDMTPSGEVGLPVMLAYLYEGGKLVGKLPEFSLSGNLYDILGKNFVGITQEGLFEHDNTQLLVTHFQLNR
jgi:PmbA protein